MTRRRVTDRATGAAHDLDPDGPPDPRRGPDPAGGEDIAGRALVEPIDGGGLEVVIGGWRFEFDVEDADRADLRARASNRSGRAAHDGPIEVRAIIPGRVATVAVTPGDVVSAGARLLSVEAMKMENVVPAPRDGTVERVAVGAGETVELGDVLVVLR